MGDRGDEQVRDPDTVTPARSDDGRNDQTETACCSSIEIKRLEKPFRLL